MPVLLFCASLPQSLSELYQLLATCHYTALEKDTPQVLSLSKAIPNVDPLAVLQAQVHPHQPHFYWEKRSQAEAVAASGTAIQDFFYGTERFSQAQTFTHTWLKRVTAVGDQILPFAGPHFFFSFSFAPDPSRTYPDAAVLLPAWHLARQGDRCTLVINQVIDCQSNLHHLTQQIWQQLETLSHPYCLRLNGVYAYAASNRLVTPIPTPPRPVEDFEATVRTALRAIETRQLHKIVLAHALDVPLQPNFSRIQMLDRLRQRYPTCYCFSISWGRSATFMGASPERLLRIENRQLLTEALAGSAPRGRTPSEDTQFSQALLTNAKELYEHQVVLDFIVQQLMQLGLRPQVPASPQILPLANIQHLWTPIQAEIPAEVYPLELAARLHPTPAVAGSPRDLACRYIQQFECFSRAFYAAPLGWVDHRGNSEFIVGIRSALVETDQARLFAGAGIVGDSNPQKEYAEVTLKLQALLNILWTC